MAFRVTRGAVTKIVSDKNCHPPKSGPKDETATSPRPPPARRDRCPCQVPPTPYRWYPPPD